MDLLVSPPKPGQPSYALFEKETSLTLNNLRDRSLYMAEKFNSLPGMSCQPADGAMYLFPKIDIPQKAIDEAEKRGKEADVMYALDLLGESSCARPRGGDVREHGRALTHRRDGYLRSGWIGLRTRAGHVPPASDGAVSGCGGLCGQD